MDFDKDDEKRICRDSLEMRRPTALVIAFVRTIHHGRGTVAMIPARRFRYPKRIEFARGRTRRINISMVEGPLSLNGLAIGPKSFLVRSGAAAVGGWQRTEL